ncbi:MAG: nitroreductase family protein [Dethiobacteria bacterium]
MELKEVIKKRRSIRHYKEDSVPQAVIEDLLTAAQMAPSATNRQPWRFIVVRDADLKNHLGEAITQPFVTKAPVILICCIDRASFTRNMLQKRVEELVSAGIMEREVADMLYQRKMPETAEEAGIPISAYIDMGIAVEHIVLMAADMGLGSCWVRMFNAERLSTILNLSPQLTPVAVLPLGYPDENPPVRPRLPLYEIVLEEGYKGDMPD